MEREYDKTLDLSRGQGTGMQSFERGNGKRWSNVISLRWEYLQLSRNFSCLWPLCPCHKLRAPECTNELEGAAPVTACIKLCFWCADGSKAQVFRACSYGSPSCGAHSCGCFASSSRWYGSLHCSPPSASRRDHDAYSTLASQSVKFLSRWSYSAWHLQILNFFVGGNFFIGVYIAQNKGTDHIHMVPGMFSQVLATTLDLVTVWHNTSLSLLAVGTHGETILWLKRFSLHVCAVGWTC